MLVHERVLYKSPADIDDGNQHSKNSFRKKNPTARSSRIEQRIYFFDVMILFDACAVESRTNGFCSGMHFLELLVGESNFKDAHNAVGANHAGHRKRNVGDAVLAVHDSRRRQNGVLIIEDALDEAASSHRDAGVGIALLIDDVVSNVDELLLDSFLRVV